MNKDLTVGKPSKVLWSFSFAMLISVMFQQFYNMIDSIIAGRYISENALAAIGVSYPITMIFMAIAVGCNAGCSVKVAQLYGAKNFGALKTAVSTSFVAYTILAVILTIFGVVFTDDMLRMFNTPENIFAFASEYLRIYIYGLGFLFLYNICNGVFNALGDSRTPLYLLIASSLGNIVMDLVFVIVFDMGIGGVAWATFVAQGLAAIVAVLLLFKRIKNIQIDGEFSYFSSAMLGKISKYAIPSILQASVVSFGNLLVQSLINGYGSSIIAGYSSAIRLNTFAITSLVTMSNALSNYTAQNVGAKKYARVKQGYNSSIWMMMCIAAPFVLSYVLAPRFMIGIFLESDSVEALDTGVTFIRILTPFFYVVMFKFISDAVLKGAGKIIFFLISTFLDLVIRVVFSYVLEPKMGYHGIAWSWPIGWTISTIIAIVFYLLYIRRLQNLEKPNSLDELLEQNNIE